MWKLKFNKLKQNSRGYKVQSIWVFGLKLWALDSHDTMPIYLRKAHVETKHDITLKNTNSYHTLVKKEYQFLPYPGEKKTLDSTSFLSRH